MLTIEHILDKTRHHLSYSDDTDVKKTSDLLRKAYFFAERGHNGQFRTSGEPYIQHPLRVTYFLAEMHLDIASLCAALLHDCVEDTSITLEEIEKEFGKEVSLLVHGVTKLGKLPWQSKEEQQAETFRNMLAIAVRDIRVILIKLSDRLDNMRSIKSLALTKQERIAKETLQIYAPLAHRLGIHFIKNELEDLCFEILYPKQYQLLSSQLKNYLKEREEIFLKLKVEILSLLQSEQIISNVFIHQKHLWSIFQKTHRTGRKLEQIFDVITFQIVVSKRKDCYSCLGFLHEKWLPIPGRFKDFIALPKSNRYQSLHTTVFTSLAEQIEVQICTEEMHLVATEGILTQWKYAKWVNNSIENENSPSSWLKQLMDWQKSLQDSTEFLETVKTDLSNREIFVFTPKGDMKILPQGSTALDFAYALHTQVGDHYATARVNGLSVPINYSLRNGDTIQIITNFEKTPQADWLKYVVTSNAKTRIKHHIRLEQRKQSKELGYKLLEQELNRHGFFEKTEEKQKIIETALQKFKLSSVEELWILIGYGKILCSQVVGTPPSARSSIPTNHVNTNNEFDGYVYPQSGLRIMAKDTHLIRLGKCCFPIPFDPIIGVMYRNKGLLVHKKTCSTLQLQDETRRIEVRWEENARENWYPLQIQLISEDRPGLLAEVSQAFHQNGMNITHANCRSEEGIAKNTFSFSVHTTEHLENLIRTLKNISGISQVERI